MNNLSSTSLVPAIPLIRMRHYAQPGVAVRAFFLFYSPQHVPSLAAHTILTNPTHPLHLPFTHRYEAQDRTTLWWTVYGTLKQLPTKVVRGWGERRLKQAFRAALLNRGFDAQGRRVVVVVDEKGDAGRGSERGEGKGNLIGTVRLQVMKPIVALRGADVREQAGWAVDRIVRLCEKEGGGGGGSRRIKLNKMKR
ncbi:MAG: hypothetical protein M1816_004629 [Peltula sp. TS41687]|nr:MAG: hypothetical protein M1816_004629 [Peltula sp. TS41687]